MTFQLDAVALPLEGMTACVAYAAIDMGARGVYLDPTYSDALAELQALGFAFEAAGPSYPGGRCRFRLRRHCRGWELHRPWLTESWWREAVGA
ncbi:hypothetical protein CCC_04067 [Paramagnetospirillum magnetotacticum MS-1]|uniref:Uncharacterized protein n=1 Tax=Paramagnetospirillum magnetotacticum MS-1 TaxID=272627 RepID=A0A0C2V386_PARME|nr:hypothetical protein [Paramagnetospirillum magnetotacticum]KIL99551.1 hypothetical protein CCC_04067 [Paramagnetospirillum magnetotacticum MS-1]